PLADAAVRDDVVRRIQPELASVDRTQFLGALERPIVIRRLLPRLAERTRDVAATQRPFLRVVGHMQQLAGVLTGRTDVHEWAAGSYVRKDLASVGADLRIVACDRWIARARTLGLFAGQRPSFRGPLGATAVEYPDVWMAEEGEHPQRVGGPPVVVVAI